MTTNAIPEGFHTITPFFTVRGAAKFIEFLKQAFDAKEVQVHAMPDGTIMNAEVRIGDSMVMMGEAPQDMGERKFMPAMFYMYVADSDAVYKRAIEAGAKSIMEPVDQFYGDRSGAVEDFTGNQWWIATRKENVSKEELEKRASQQKKK